jgi:hypothetical protein
MIKALASLRFMRSLKTFVCLVVLAVIVVGGFFYWRFIKGDSIPSAAGVEHPAPAAPSSKSPSSATPAQSPKDVPSEAPEKLPAMELGASALLSAEELDADAYVVDEHGNTWNDALQAWISPEGFRWDDREEVWKDENGNHWDERLAAWVSAEGLIWDEARSYWKDEQGNHWDETKRTWVSPDGFLWNGSVWADEDGNTWDAGKSVWVNAAETHYWDPQADSWVELQ